ncbi:hypothetical protein L596_025453 [Steinernema carpocapsae]|uniref:Pre-mRNA polyadenylation factor Fip1 domain-containing protein n=1 Tax=Steinernema carpocapsae TaxID=34508 RepID=A0A4U5M7U6_STECR|nr:hypothetical protein L596_025453 [Steinernema carpocapsae]
MDIKVESTYEEPPPEGMEEELQEEEQQQEDEVMKEEPQEEAEENGEEAAEDGEGSTEGGEENEDEEEEVEDEEDDSDDDDFVVHVGEIKRPEPKVQPVQGKVDLDGTPTINGQPIYDLDLASMEDRPWRKPGADPNDYFNYGFNEETWNTYCERQRKLRHEYSGNQGQINRALFNSISLTNPVLTTTSSGRQLVNICGAENPHNNHKVVVSVDLTKPPPASTPMGDQKPILRMDLTSQNVSPPDVKSIPTLDFSKPPPGMQNLVSASGSVPQDGPPGVDDSAPGTEPTTPSIGGPPGTGPPGMPPMDMSVPPPGFNPSMPPPPIRIGGVPPAHLPPPVFGGMPSNHAMAGFSNPPPHRFGRPAPLRDFHGAAGYGPPPGMENFERDPRDYRGERSSGESDDDDHRRRKHRRRSRSRSPSTKRRRDEKERDRERDRGDRDYGRDSERDRDRDRDRDRERRRRHEDGYERESSRSSRSRRDREERGGDKDRGEKERRHRGDSDSEREGSRKDRRRREGSGDKESSRRDRGKE